MERKQIDTTFLDVLDSQLAEHGQKISTERQNFIDKLEKLAQKFMLNSLMGLRSCRLIIKLIPQLS